LADYVSFYGYMAFYLHNLRPKAQSSLRESLDASQVASGPNASVVTTPGSSSVEPNSRTRLILGGYSYGSMVASHLPTFDAVMQAFACPKPGSPEAEIQLRASRLASRRIKASASKRQSRGRSLRVNDAVRNDQSQSLSVAMGGDESEATSRRASRDSRRSLDLEGLRKSLDISRKRFGSRRESSEDELEPTAELMRVSDLQEPDICYLLVSPLLPPVAMFVTMFTKMTFTGKGKSPSTTADDKAADNAKSELVTHKTLAVYGDKDFFTAQRKLRKWAEQLYREKESKFRFVEIDGAGHFWHETGAAERLKAAVRSWIESLGS